ncbi:MAG: hypothetical protein R2751_02565 [Bacteroidales bacterium]
MHGAGQSPELTPGSNYGRMVEARKLYFYAGNSVTYLPGPPGEGGRGPSVDNILRRLEIQYPNRHSVAIREKASEHVVEIKISL